MVPAARTFVRAFLGSHPLAGDAELVASEYVTNAIRHTASGDGGVIHVTVAATPRTVRIEVTDHGRASPDTAAATVPAVPPAPKRKGASEDDENGRGLLIVDFLAARWGHFGLSGGQVTAWAELGEPGEPEAREERELGGHAGSGEGTGSEADTEPGTETGPGKDAEPLPGAAGE
jgi:anti-sigma regulatory factor (Ser/Thr protein kinase)